MSEQPKQDVLVSGIDSEFEPKPLGKMVTECPLAKRPPSAPQKPKEDPPVPDETKFYGFTEKIEFNDATGGSDIYFGVLEKKWFDENGGKSADEYWADPDTVPQYLLTVAAGRCIPPAADYDPFAKPGKEVEFKVALPETGYAKELEERRWYSLELEKSDPGGMPKGIFQTDDDKLGPELERYIVKIEPIPGGALENLKRLYSWEALQKPNPQAADINQNVLFVGVMEVGQGGCNAIYSPDGRPFLYYDFGTGQGHHRSPTNPVVSCFRDSPTIVLSHFDRDHYDLGKETPGAKYMPWLVPDQNGLHGYAPADGRFLRKLRHVRLWPQNRVAFEEYSWGFIERCTGNTTNDGGLAVLVRVQDDTNAPPVGQRAALDANGTRPEIFPDERYVVMSGDGPFHYVPSCANGDLHGQVVGINAPHHGAHTDGILYSYDSIPIPAGPYNGLAPQVTYSAGMNPNTLSNKHGHPNPNAIAFYAARGYHRTRKTTIDAGMFGIQRSNFAQGPRIFDTAVYQTVLPIFAKRIVAHEADQAMLLGGNLVAVAAAAHNAANRANPPLAQIASLPIVRGDVGGVATDIDNATAACVAAAALDVPAIPGYTPMTDPANAFLPHPVRAAIATLAGLSPDGAHAPNPITPAYAVAAMTVNWLLDLYDPANAAHLTAYQQYEQAYGTYHASSVAALEASCISEAAFAIHTAAWPQFANGGNAVAVQNAANAVAAQNSAFMTNLCARPVVTANNTAGNNLIANIRAGALAVAAAAAQNVPVVPVGMGAPHMVGISIQMLAALTPNPPNPPAPLTAHYAAQAILTQRQLAWYSVTKATADQAETDANALTLLIPGIAIPINPCCQAGGLLGMLPTQLPAPAPVTNPPAPHGLTTVGGPVNAAGAVAAVGVPAPNLAAMTAYFALKGQGAIQANANAVAAINAAANLRANPGCPPVCHFTAFNP